MLLIRYYLTRRLDRAYIVVSKGRRLVASKVRRATIIVALVLTR